MPTTYWGDSVMQKLKYRLVRSSAKIDQVIGRPEPLRRADTKDLLIDFMTDPEKFETPEPGKVFVGRAKLAEYVKESYGIHARHILPYLQEEPEETNEQGLQEIDPRQGGAPQ